MSYIRTNRQSSGGGSGQTLLWARSTYTLTGDSPSGFSFALSTPQIPVDADSIIVSAEGQSLFITTGFTYNSGPHSISVLGAWYPSETTAGEIIFEVFYPYAVT